MVLIHYEQITVELFQLTYDRISCTELGVHLIPLYPYWC